MKLLIHIICLFCLTACQQKLANVQEREFSDNVPQDSNLQDKPTQQNRSEAVSKNRVKSKVEKDKFTHYYDLWNRRKFSNYQITAKNFCFCPTDYRLAVTYSVVNESVTRARFVESKRVVSQDILSSLKTIDQVFDLIKQNLDKAEHMEIKYNEEHGFPSSVFIDKDRRMADEEVIMEFYDLRIHSKAYPHKLGQPNL